MDPCFLLYFAQFPLKFANIAGNDVTLPLRFISVLLYGSFLVFHPTSHDYQFDVVTSIFTKKSMAPNTFVIPDLFHSPVFVRVRK